MAAKHYSQAQNGSTTKPAQAQTKGTARHQQAPKRQASSATRQKPPAQAYVPNALPSYGVKPKKSKARRRIVALLSILLLAAIFGGVAYFFTNPPFFGVTVNGAQVTVDRGDTLESLIEKGEVTPQAGNLIALDGSILEEGGGTRYSAKINGQPVMDGGTKLSKGNIIEIGDGEDVMEEATVSEETIAHGTIEADTSYEAYWTGSLHVYEKGQDGLVVTTVGAISGITETREVTKAIDAGYHIYTANTGDDKVLALTFDDGPWDTSTAEILDILEANGAKATFFTIGNQVVDHVDQVKRAAELGMQICTHSYDHASGSGQGVNLTYMSADEQIWEVQQGYKTLADVLGAEPTHIIRAPGGNYYGDIIQTLEPYVDAEIGWDVDTEDWKQPGSDAIYEAIMSASSGQVVLMHDGGGDRSQTVEAVSRAVPELVAQGYKLVTISELLEYENS